MKKLNTFLTGLSVAKQFFFARTIYDWAIFVFDSFYMTYVFKESGQVSTVVVNMLVTFLTIYIGFVLGSLLMNKIGAERNLKVSFVLYIITGLVGIFAASSFAAPYIIISIFRGMAEGFYWASVNFVELSGVPHASRSKFYSLSQSLNSVFFIVMPIALGYLLYREGDLLPIYIIFSILCVIGAVFPFNFSINQKINIKKEHFREIFADPRFGKYVVMRLIISIMWMIDWLMYAVIAFVILGNELNMGVFLAVSSLIGVVISLLTYKVAIENKAKVGFWMLLMSSLALSIFAFNLTAFAMYLTEMIRSIAGSVSNPAEFDLSVRSTNEMKGEKDIGAELNIVQESIFTIARFIFGGVFLLVYPLFHSTASVLTAIIVLYVVLRIVNYLLLAKFLNIRVAGKAN
jgi:YQGE family putative transporter